MQPASLHACKSVATVLTSGLRTSCVQPVSFDEGSDACTSDPTSLDGAQLRAACSTLGLVKTGALVLRCQALLCSYSRSWGAGTKALLISNIMKGALPLLRIPLQV